MKENLNQKALEILEKNIILNIDIIEPIKRGHGEVKYAEDTTVLIYEQKSKSYMLHSEEIKKALEILNQQDKTDVHTICVHQHALLQAAKNQFNIKNHISCYQTANLDKKLVEIPNQLKINALDTSYKEIIYTHYQNYNLEELQYLLEQKQIFGGFKENTLVGFIGMHLEGSCGLLEIFPEHRKKGYGTTLEAYMNNYVIQKGWTPYGQVVEDNQKSIALQKKLGMTISKEKIYWAF